MAVKKQVNKLLSTMTNTKSLLNKRFLILFISIPLNIGFLLVDCRNIVVKYLEKSASLYPL